MQNDARNNTGNHMPADLRIYYLGLDLGLQDQGAKLEDWMLKTEVPCCRLSWKLQVVYEVSLFRADTLTKWFFYPCLTALRFSTPTSSTKLKH